jgi:hypothetical protein
MALTKNITAQRLADTATGLQNKICHREIIKQRSLDFSKACSRLFLKLSINQRSL